MKKYEQHQHQAHHTARNVIALLIVVLAFAMFLVFYIYGEKILMDGSANQLFTLAVVGAGLLVGLLYLVSHSHPHKATLPKATKKAKVKKKK
jgi:hypothetical protein